MDWLTSNGCPKDKGTVLLFKVHLIDKSSLQNHCYFVIFVLNNNGIVTLIKGDRVIQVKIKSKVMLINGVSITMDVAPEIKDGRTILPFRFKKGSCFEKNLFVVK